MQLNRKITYLIGRSNIDNRPLKVFNNEVCLFLTSLANSLLKDKESKKYPDIISFAYWIRSSNIIKIKERFRNLDNIGRGLVLHIVPSNVPLAFAYSFSLGLLAGNANFIKLSNNIFPQSNIVIKKIKSIIKNKKFSNINKMQVFAKYNNENNEITNELFMQCDARVIWGSDLTVNKLKTIKTSPRVVDLIFSDRYSISLINLDSLKNISQLNWETLINNFYVDNFYFDQNACSSTHLVFWHGKNKRLKKKFWSKLYELTKKKYKISEYGIISKLTRLQIDKINFKKNITNLNFQNILQVVTLKKLYKNISNLRGFHGYFYEFHLKNLNYLNKFIDPKIQTLSYFGFDKNKLKKIFIEKRFRGIDRIVPFGKALEFSENWDGHDIINTLSRNININ
jgi:hypothetical protein